MSDVEVLVVYDVATGTPQGRRRLRRVARICEGYGQRVQYSVFEVVASPADWAKLRTRLAEAADDQEDSLRFYLLSDGTLSRCQSLGGVPMCSVTRSHGSSEHDPQ